MKPIDFLPGATRDFQESFDWYAAQSMEAAAHFTEAIDAALHIVAADPERFFALDECHRAYLVKRFPFRIIYRILENRILIVAVAHAKRRPGYWYDRS